MTSINLEQVVMIKRDRELMTRRDLEVMTRREREVMTSRHRTSPILTFHRRSPIHFQSRDPEV
jgi:hypothetical protein